MLPEWTKKDPRGRKVPKETSWGRRVKNELIHEKTVLIKSMKVAENCVDEGNTDLENLTKSKIVSLDKLIASQTKISLGLKRKVEFSA